MLVSLITDTADALTSAASAAKTTDSAPSKLRSALMSKVTVAWRCAFRTTLPDRGALLTSADVSPVPLRLKLTIVPASRLVLEIAKLSTPPSLTDAALDWT